jgi:PTH1 family peptidyl-tRNA hydrolase
MKLIVGLGNIGDKYKNTRHNAGFMAVDELFDRSDFQPFKKSDKFKAEIAEGEILNEKALLLKPHTFMNLSGEAVSYVMNFYKIPLEDLIVIHDDADLPYGTMRIRPDGSDGGHKGIKSIIEHTGSQGFCRIRIGIQPPSLFKGRLEDYVLGKFTDEEKHSFISAIDKVPTAVKTILEQGIDEAMNRFNS